MIGRKKMLAVGLAAALTAGLGSGPALAHGQGMGWGMMGPGSGWCPMMMGYGGGPGMMGPGMMGYGMMGYGMGPGMMSYGMGPGMMGPGMMGPGMMGPGKMGQGMMGSAQALESLDVASVKANLERWLEWQGNPRLKVGNVAEKDAATISAEIVTTDNSLVEMLEVDRRTGMMWPVR
jgi:hypothetical protein